jgi:uncharacterized membrane protein (UPF0182 family)
MNGGGGEKMSVNKIMLVYLILLVLSIAYAFIALYYTITANDVYGVAGMAVIIITLFIALRMAVDNIIVK